MGDQTTPHDNIDDMLQELITSGATHASLVEDARNAVRLFIVWQGADGSWHNGWKGAEFDMIGHVEWAKYCFMRDCVAETDDDDAEEV